MSSAVDVVLSVGLPRATMKPQRPEEAGRTPTPSMTPKMRQSLNHPVINLFNLLLENNFPDFFPRLKKQLINFSA